MSNHNNDGFIVVLICVVFVLLISFGFIVKPSNNCKDIDNSTQHSPTR